MTPEQKHIATDEEASKICQMIESENHRELGMQQAKQFHVNPDKVLSSLLKANFKVFHFDGGQLTFGGVDNSTLNGEVIRVGNYLNVTLIRDKREDEIKVSNCSLEMLTTIQADLNDLF